VNQESTNAAFIEFMRVTNETITLILDRLEDVESEVDDLTKRVVALENKPNPFQVY
jgi:hypothetical protein